ncbi:MAG: hypothetical protein ABSA77_13305 [Thermoguttaceae bacterium]|jgi:hypothetical protein
MAKEDAKSDFWNIILRAIEVEPISATSIRGASGFSHPIVSVGVDEKRSRVVVISGEPDARSAALAYNDIQAAMPSLKMIMAHPVAVNLGEVARIASEMLGRVSIGQREFQWLNEKNDNLVAQINQFAKELFKRSKQVTLDPFIFASLNSVAVWMNIIQQLSLIEIETQSHIKTGGSSEVPATEELQAIHLTKLIALDPAENDRRLGVCPIPLYEIAPEEVEIIQAGADVEAVREILRRHDILQYFFPSADQLALGFADRSVMLPGEIVDHLIRTPEVGHPFGELEIVEPSVEIKDMVAALQDRGLLVEGEAGVEITDQGSSFRSKVRFKPRESLLARLARIFSVKIHMNLKDLFK